MMRFGELKRTSSSSWCFSLVFFFLRWLSGRFVAFGHFPPLSSPALLLSFAYARGLVDSARWLTQPGHRRIRRSSLALFVARLPSGLPSPEEKALYAGGSFFLHLGRWLSIPQFGESPLFPSRTGHANLGRWFEAKILFAEILEARSRVILFPETPEGESKIPLSVFSLHMMSGMSTINTLEGRGSHLRLRVRKF